MTDYEDQDSRTSQEIDSDGNLGMGRSDVEGDSASGSIGGSETPGASQGDPGREVGTNSPELRDNFRSRPATGIPGHREVDPSEVLLQAFIDGDFPLALSAAQELQLAYHEALLESGKLRFKLNFGTTVCESCEGLKAGPDVVATCFQIKKCEFKSIRNGAASPRQLQILRKMTTE